MISLRSIATSLSILALSVFPACSKEHAAGDGHEPAGEAEHGAAGAVPGSYEDWCGEDAVLESKCTRCDASLVAAFKATGDWCDEHGLPESQCLKCDPDLKIERPPKPDGR